MDDARLITGDCLEVLPTLGAGSVHCCITSPPYFGLRDYGTATWEGGDEGCDHGRARKAIGNTPSAKSTLTTNGGRGPKPGDKYSSESQGGYANDCPCGARRIDAQLGLEKTPQEYVARMVAVFRGVRRVLRDDGTLWLNLGDSYNAGTTKPSGPSKTADVGGWTTRSGDAAGARRTSSDTCKVKDLLGIPWRVAFALQDDGWYLRQDLIWSKPNPMPESVTDRCTKAHEYVFLLSKSPRYYYDQETMKEPAVPQNRTGKRGHRCPKDVGGYIRGARASTRSGLNGPTGDTRNRRSVWTVATQPYPEAHFATFPPALVRPMVLAGCPVGGTVLDPFAGSGTTGAVALQHDRKFVGVELNPAYVALARKRLVNVIGHLFAGPDSPAPRRGG